MEEIKECTFGGGIKGYPMNIYKQDPSVIEVGIRRVLITSNVEPGPEDELIRTFPLENRISMEDLLIDLCPIKKYNSEDKLETFDRVHTFAVCRMVLTMYERAINRLGKYEDAKGNRKPILKNKDGVYIESFDFKKEWNCKKLQLFHRDRLNDNLEAGYDSVSNSIRFGQKEGVYSCRSFDVIAHETGHAVLAAIWKGKKRGSDQEKALSEAFSDLTVLFSILAQLDMCDAILAHYNGDLLNGNFLAHIAEEFGMARRKEKDENEALFYLRDLTEVHLFDEVNQGKQHAFSQVFSGAVYRFFVGVFQDYIELDKYDPASSLFQVNRYITGITLGAYYLTAQEPETTFASLGNEMIKLVTKMKSINVIGNKKSRSKWEEDLKKILKERKII